MDILEISPKDRLRVKQFLNLPFQIYREYPAWVPPIAADARRFLDVKRHPFYAHSEASFYLAVEGTSPVGRLAVLNNHNYNAFNHENSAFFYLFECFDHPKAVLGLFEAGICWAQRRGLTRMLGPKGFSALDGMGMLVEGFEHRPAMGIPYNPPYYPFLIETAGFVQQEDILSGYLDANVNFPEKIHQLSEIVQKRRGFHIMRFKKRRDLLAIVPRLQAMYNAALAGTTGNVPLTDAEVKIIAQQLLLFADPRLIKIIMKEDEPVGFLFAYPDVSTAIQRTRGRIYPFGWILLLVELRRTKWVNINGVGLIEKYRGLGGTAILFSEMYKSIEAGGYRYADVVQIGASNERMLRELRDIGVNFYKTHRIYQRNL
jgi:hypothetical protein